jgi:hypothetical protein
MNHKKIETGNGQVGIGNTQAVSVFFHASSRLQAKMVNANIQPLMRPIDLPFVGDWDIDQVFQLSVGDGQAYAFGYFDVIQQEFFVKIGREGGPYYAVRGNFTLRQLLEHMRVDLNDPHFTEAGWAGLVEGDRPPMPDLDDTQALLDLTMQALHRDHFAASFNVAAPLLPLAVQQG